MIRCNWPWLFVGIQTTAILVYIFQQTTFEDKTIRQLRKIGRNSRLKKLSTYDESVLERLENLITRKADSTDPELVQLVREIMDPPAISHPIKLSRLLYQTPQAKAVDDYLKGMERGFYVEVGGFDGERSSNSIFFEVQRYWRGLLIEADLFFYTQLLGKNRRSWSINACLSSSDYVSKLRFQESHTGKGQVFFESEPSTNKNPGGITFFADVMVVPCFPLETILLALGEIKVDFFSLDVEGMELEILKAMDFKKINTRTLAVEFAHGNKSAIRNYMEESGYRVLQEINEVDYANFLFANDFIFVKV